MPDLNNIKSNITVLREKIMSDLNTLAKMYGDLESGVSERFRTEYQKNSGSMNGLEDFYMLNSIVKKNSLSARQAHSILKRMRDIADYEITEEEVLDKELEELLKTN